MKRGQPCFVKALSVTGSKMSLSMHDADQKTGADLNPLMRLPDQALQPLHEELRSNPTRGEREREAAARAGGSGRGRAVILLRYSCNIITFYYVIIVVVVWDLQLW